MGVHKKIFCIVAGLGLMFLLSCRKDKKDPYVHIPGWSIVDEQTLSYLFQSEGTVFIYIDSVSGSYDTVTVTNRLTDTTEVWIEQRSEGPLYYEQGQSQTNFSSFDQGTTTYFARLGSPSTSTYFTILKSKFGLGLGENYFMQCPFYEGLVFTNTGLYTEIEKRHDSLNVNGQVYYDVFQVITKKESGEAYADVRYFYAKNIGLVKKINYKTNTNWNLTSIQHQ